MKLPTFYSQKKASTYDSIQNHILKYRSHYFSTILLGTLGLLAGCQDPQPPAPQSRACETYERQQATGRDEQQLAVSVQEVRNLRDSCDEGVRFMSLFTASLFQSGQYSTPNEAQEYGYQYCAAQYGSHGWAIQNGRYRGVRLLRMEGCRRGIADAIRYTRGINAMLAGRHAVTSTTDLDSAFAQAAQLTNAVIHHQQATTTAQTQMRNQQTAQQNNSTAQQTEATTATSLEQTRRYVANLHARESAIMLSRNQATTARDELNSQLSVIINRMQPNENAFAAADAAKNQAIHSNQAARSRLNDLISRISHSRSRKDRLISDTHYQTMNIAIVRSEAASLRSEARSFNAQE